MNVTNLWPKMKLLWVFGEIFIKKNISMSNTSRLEYLKFLIILGQKKSFLGDFAGKIEKLPIWEDNLTRP